MKSDTSGLTHLGSSGTQYATQVNPALLERFAFPGSKDKVMTLHIEAPEFTSLCPLTGQPDFAKIVIDYQPKRWCVESKSLKLYLFSYRGEGEFHEACVDRICSDLVTLLEPVWMKVVGEFTPRGGIPFWPTSFYSQDGLDDIDFLYSRLGRVLGMDKRR